MPRRCRPALCLALLLSLAASPSAQAGFNEGMAAFQKRDWATAANEFRPLADKGNAAAQARLGHILFQGLLGNRDDVEALRLINASASAGDAFGQHLLGNAYFFGRGVPKDPATALVWYGRAADKDQPESLHALGEIHFNGLGVGKNEARGIEYYTRAADKGVPASLEKLAELNWGGRAMPTNRTKAVEYATRAAASGRMGAQFLLGVAKLTGDGTEKNAAEAVQWFRKAAEQGHPQSQHNLGVTTVTGLGTAKNPAEGYFWLALAAERAPANLKANYEKERDGIGAKLTPAELAAARARVIAWKPPSQGGAAVPITVAPPAASPSTTGRAQPPMTASQPSGPITTLAPPESSTQRNATTTGTGFVITRDGTILTNAHVVEQCRTISIKPQDGPPVVAGIIAKDTGDDLALLKTTLRVPQPARFREDKPMRSGDEVVVIGYPLSSLLSREPNITAGVISAMAGIRGDSRHYQITAPVQKGNSGGPLVDTSGNIVGVVSSKLNAMKVADRTGDIPQNVNFAIKADLTRKFLERYGVAYETAPAGPTLSAADVGEMVSKVTVFIQCKAN
ncbi:hypothetical protein A6A04_07545 [Paramagnetospirillum marisnigri]|uniref:TPR repeat n=1 Tax=Paramagnetospirillum marisnigri TaxID=1285242 RepID=A0A178M9F7_9PROT|nr:tetratricopeptide repeat-containing serine protease family protein [Paramagnetospirillum marisnigri]OAN44675.1 hypothetical protein A6A04_07545 [Paramagnetospirillum marisnigri]